SEHAARTSYRPGAVVTGTLTSACSSEFWGCIVTDPNASEVAGVGELLSPLSARTATSEPAVTVFGLTSTQVSVDAAVACVQPASSPSSPAPSSTCPRRIVGTHPPCDRTGVAYVSCLGIEGRRGECPDNAQDQ